MGIAIDWELLYDDAEGLTSLEDELQVSLQRNRWAEKHLKPKLVYGVTITLSSELYYDVNFGK